MAESALKKQFIGFLKSYYGSPMGGLPLGLAPTSQAQSFPAYKPGLSEQLAHLPMPQQQQMMQPGMPQMPSAPQQALPSPGVGVGPSADVAGAQGALLNYMRGQ